MILDELNSKLELKIEAEKGFFAIAIAYQEALLKQPEIATIRERICSLLLKRTEQIFKRRELIYNSLSLEELEQLVIS